MLQNPGSGSESGSALTKNAESVLKTMRIHNTGYEPAPCNVETRSPECAVLSNVADPGSGVFLTPGSGIRDA